MRVLFELILNRYLNDGFIFVCWYLNNVMNLIFYSLFKANFHTWPDMVETLLLEHTVLKWCYILEHRDVRKFIKCLSFAVLKCDPFRLSLI